MRNSISLFLCILMLTACSSKPAIEGTVKDYFGRPVQGVQVTIENSAFTELTDADGKYQLEYVPGAFKVIFSKGGYSTNTMELNLATEDKFPAKDTVLAKLPDKPGVYFYEEDRTIPLVPNKLKQAGTMMESVTGISNLSDNFTKVEKPAFIIYGNQYSGKSFVINRLTFTEEATFRNIMKKTKSRINMWTAGEDAVFKSIPLEANERLMIAQIDQELQSGRYAISWGGLSIDTPAIVSGKSTDVYDFEYLNPKVFSDLRETAIYTAESINLATERWRALSAIAAEIAKAGDQERANILFSQAIQAAETINLAGTTARWRALSAIAAEIAKAGDQERANNLFAQAIQAAGKDYLLLSAIAAEIAKTGDQKRADNLFAKAIKAADSMDGTMRSLTLHQIASNMLKEGDYERAENILSRANQWGEMDSGILLSEIAIKIAKAGDYDKSIQVAENINEFNKPRALSAIAAEIAKLGDYDKAIQVAETIKTDWEKVSTLSAIAAEIAKTGDQKRADKLFAKAIQIAETIKKDWPKSMALAAIAEEMAKAGNSAKAIQIAETIKDDSSKSGALAAIAKEMAKAGNSSKAIQIAETIKDDSSKRWALAAIAEEMAKAGNSAKAIQIAETTLNGRSKGLALAAIAAEIAKTGDQKRADNLFAKAIQAVETTDDRALRAIIEECTNAGNYAKAIQAAETIKDDNVKNKEIRAIAIQLAKPNDYTKEQEGKLAADLMEAMGKSV